MKMRFTLFLAATAVSVSGSAIAGGQGAGSDAVCIVNGSEKSHVFVVEARGGERKMGRLSPGERLCAGGASEQVGGVVSVFEHEEAFEGCSRIVGAGQTEVMEQYVDFDRCFWRSNS